MKNMRILFPLVIVLSLLLGAGGMYAVMAAVDGDNSSVVLEESQVKEMIESNENEVEEVSGSIETDEDRMEKIEQAFQVISDRYVNEVDESELLEGAISGMLETLDDPYSVYMDASTAEEFMESLDSSFEGIGAEVSMTNGKVTIVAPFRDSPAEEAGLRPNDQIIEIDGEDIEGLSLNEAVLQIRGEKGTTVTLTIERPGVNDPIEIDVVRDEIPLITVYSDIVEEDGKSIGVIELRSFSENTAELFEEELMKLESEGIDGLVIDVRGNPGGFLQSVEDIGNLIIPGGEPIVQIEGRDGERTRHISNLEDEKEYPIITLIDEGSASASEILAAALKEAGGHDVVGKSTFGKGTVQQTIPMEDGSQIKLTLFRWLTSAGNDINKEGVEPTIEVDQPDYFYASPLNIEDPLSFDMSSDHVKNAQIMLKGIGEDPGRTDGYFDRQTEEAVTAFQEREDLEVTGEINEETADLLQQRVIESVQDRDSDNQFKKAIELLTGE
ncbi:peptidase S41 [Salipaludibacillus keqinensis]|uniref:C-terminal processing peptidase n=1 Tax=Salipaludibacillus keqinensis TaxID=2045207 RepID=A0A323THF9_9BACI|nr:S41 family peptidase [Salipaludibacillus keqinensis]PYZ92967.1 peptidase S41 [Salipaludibacillus keqinensis]